MKSKGRFMTAPSVLMSLLTFLPAGSVPAAAQTENVLHAFQGGADGSHPAAGLVADKAGNLYGTTTSQGFGGFGTVFELSPPATPGGAWTATTLYAFQGFLTTPPDGSDPEAALALDEQGNLYGATALGGNACGFYECGTVFKLIRPQKPGQTWQESVIYSFSGSDGQSPYSSLTRGPGGRLYGTTISGGTLAGGAYGSGTVFELSPPDDDHPAGPWTARVLYSFAGSPDGAAPAAGVVFDRAGNLYGTTTAGGVMDSGTVFKLTRPTVHGGAWTESTLYSFTGGSDGGDIQGGVVFDDQGNLYGAAAQGGNYAGGTIFQLTPPASVGGAWSENTLYQFTYYGPDGGGPFGTPILDRKGNLFGTASGGSGNGTVFELKPPGSGAGSWAETTLYSFLGATGGPQPDGAYPVSSLLLGKHGVLLGTTLFGGDFIGDGTVFEIVP